MSFDRKFSLDVLGNVQTIQYLGGEHTQPDDGTACAISKAELTRL